MEGETLHFSLWEDDAPGAGHSKENEENFIASKQAQVVNGRAEVSFSLIYSTMAPIANRKIPAGQKDEGKYHEYYVTVTRNEGADPEKSSGNVDVNNPDYVPLPPKPQPKSKETPKAQPQAQPKKKEPQVIHKDWVKEKAKPPASAWKEPKIIKVYIRDTQGKVWTRRPKYGEKIRIYIESVNMVNCKIKVRIYDKDKFSNDLLHEEDRTINASPNFLTISLNKSMQDKGGDVWYQNIFAEISLYDTKQTVKSEVIDVDKTDFSVPKPEGVNPVIKKVPEQKKEEKDCVCKQYDLIWGAKVSCEFRKKVVEICKELWGENKKIEMANGLMAVMYIETSGTFSPSKIELKSTNEKRKDGSYKRKYRGLTKEEILKLNENFSGPVGLIQFTPPAIKSLNKQYGYNLTKRKFELMTDLQQLNYVKKYFELNKANTKIKTPEDIYLHVFAPIGVNKNDDFVLYDREKNKKEYDSNESVDAKDGNNDGEIQRREILNRYYTSFNEGKNNKENNFTCGITIPVKKAEKKNNKIVTFDDGLTEERKKVVTQKSIGIIEKAAINSSNNKIIITSTIRSTRKQAEVMYTNESNGNHIRYAAPGREVIQVFNEGKSKRLSKETIINNMDKKIIELGSQGRRVSLHCVSKETYSKNNIIDISYTRGVTNKIDLTKELEKMNRLLKLSILFQISELQEN